jgi:hypothetical protein
VPSEFGRRLKDVVDAARSEVEHVAHRRAANVEQARARRRHLERVAMAEAQSLLEQSAPVFASMGLRPRMSPIDNVVESIPGARLPEAHPPWFMVRCRPAAEDEVQVAVVEVTWRVDDPRTPLPESPSVLRMVLDEDGAGALGELRDFLSVALEDFATQVVKHDLLPRA